MSMSTTAEPSIAGPGNGRRLASLACLLLVGSLLGLSLVVAKIAVVEGAAPLAFLSVSMIAAGTVLLVGEWWNGRVPHINRRIAEYGLMTGALFAAPNAVGFLAVEHVGAGFLSLTFAFPILFTYLLSLGLRLERLQAAKALGVASGLAGGLILALSKVNLGTSPTFWVVLAMSSPVIIAAANIYRTLRWPSGVSPMFLASAMLLCGGVLLIPFASLQAPDGFAGLFATRSLSMILLAQIAIFSVLYVFYFVLQRLAGPVYLSQIGTVAAVVGTLVAVLLLGEPIPPNLALAAAFIAGAMVLFHLRKRVG